MGTSQELEDCFIFVYRVCHFGAAKKWGKSILDPQDNYTPAKYPIEQQYLFLGFLCPRVRRQNGYLLPSPSL